MLLLQPAWVFRCVFQARLARHPTTEVDDICWPGPGYWLQGKFGYCLHGLWSVGRGQALAKICLTVSGRWAWYSLDGPQPGVTQEASQHQH